MRAQLIRTAGAVLAALALAAPGAGADTFEPNNSIGQATGPLTPLTPYVSFIGTFEDIDYYYLDADLGAFVAELEVPADLGIDYDLFVVDGDENILVQSINDAGIDELIQATVTTAGRFYIVVQAFSGFSDTQAYQLTVDFVPLGTPPTVQVTSPNGGETWSPGEQRNVTWTASDAEDGSNLSIAVAFSTNGGSSFTPIASGLGNTGSFTWTVPDAPTTQARVRVTATDTDAAATSDQSDANFTIQAAQPVGTAVLTLGSGIQVNAGQTVSVPVNLQHTQAMAGFQVTVNYDASRLTATNVVKESRAAALDLGKNVAQAGKVVFTLTSTTGATVAAGNGVVASIQFLAGSVGGAVPLTPTDAVVSDAMARAMTLTVNAGSVTVVGTPAQVTLQVPGALSVDPGGVLDVPVTFNSNLAVSALQFALTFNPAVLTPVSMTQGGRTTGMTMEENLGASGQVRAVFFFPGGGSLAPGSGTACTIRFNGAPSPPGNTALTFADVVCSDASGNAIAVTTSSGQVTGVRLAAFTAETDPAGVRVLWSAVADDAHAGFRVLRGNDVPVALHAGLLPPDASEYLDSGAEPGRTHRYWLEAVDRDGGVQRFGPVAVSVPAAGFRVGAPYPNPMRAETRVQASGLDAGARALVVDVSGRRVRELAVPAGGAGTLIWDGRDDAGAPVPQGMYFIRIVSGSGEATRRLIKTGS